jgi:riboflavin kinase/FMN adenylyltransferase
MKVIYAIGKVKPALSKTVAAIGIFDGVHKGHQSLIRRMVACARREKMKSVVITFHPHPVEVLHKKKVFYLVSLPQRLKLMEALGVDIVLVIKFTRSFAHLKPEGFVRKYLVQRLGIREVFVGDDFRFGENRAGDVDLFTQMGAKYGFKVNHMHPVEKTSSKISSSWLRELIGSGRLREAVSMLGRNVSILGKVVHGDGRGKSLGYPTANIKFDCGVLPPHGVYVVGVDLDGKRFRGIVNIGLRPSFKHKDPSVKLEVYILDFNKNIYGRDITVEFLKKIRNEKIFSSAEHLTRQIRRDEQVARRYFQSHAL